MPAISKLLYNKIYVTAKRLKHFSWMFAARQHAYLSPFKLKLCSNGMDHGTRHIQRCHLLHSPTSASMHDRCIRRYLKFRGLCLYSFVMGKNNLCNGQFMLQGQFQIHFHSSLINNFKNIKKYETSQYESSHSAWYETEHQFSFEVFDNFSIVYVSLKIWQLEECM